MAKTTRIAYVTIDTLGNTTDFGDLTEARNSIATASNSSRGVFMGGSTPTKVDKMDYITIASTGNATDFGDLLAGSQGQGRGNMSNTIRGVFAGGSDPSTSNVMQYITIASTGNALDYGDLITAKLTPATVGNGQGGLVGG